MNMNLRALALPLPINSLEAYIHYVNQIPMLTQTEEYELARHLKTTNDLEAAKRLILAHARYVVKVARNYSGYGLPLGDLIQEGNIGLMKAIKRFNPEIGVRLVTFAIHWIKSEIHEFVLRNWRIVKIATTKAQRKLFFNLRSAKNRLTWFTPDEINEVAKDLGVKPETVREMEMRLYATDASIEAQNDNDDEGGATIPAGYLADHSNPANTMENSNWLTQSNTALYDALNRLDERYQAIIKARWLNDNKVTLQDLAKQFSISAERVRQLEKTALQKLKAALNS